jgi:hypothetical protein
VLALLRGNTTFRSTFVKLFHEGDIKIDDELERDPELYDPELHSEGEGEGEGEGNVGMIPPAIPLKRGRG